MLYQYFATACLAVVLLTACEVENLEGRLGGELDVPITYYLEKDSTYSDLVELLKVTDLFATIGAYNPENAEGNYTLFAPTNLAFDHFIAESKYGSFDEFKADISYVKEALLMHVLSGAHVRNAFAVGAQSKKTLNEERLTFVFQQDQNRFKINERAFVVGNEVVLANGIIHTVDAMLLPYDKTALESLKERAEYSLFTAALEQTYIYEENSDSENSFIKSNTTLAQLLDVHYDSPEDRLTVFVVSDQEFASNGIETLAQLQDWAVDRYLDLYPNKKTITSPDYMLYMLMGLHIIEGGFYHVDFESFASGYATVNNEILRISNSSMVKLLEGVATFDTIIDGQDTALINYISLDLNKSNISTQTAVIHDISDILQLAIYSNLDDYYRAIPRSEEEVLAQLYNSWADLIEDSPELEEHFTNDSLFSHLSYTGEQGFSYHRASADFTSAYGLDYLSFDGFFEMTYTTEKELTAGEYELLIKGAGDVVVDVYVDGKLAKMRFAISRSITQFNMLNAAEPIPLSFVKKGTHTITIKTVTPGVFYLDFYSFNLVKSF